MPTPYCFSVRPWHVSKFRAAVTTPHHSIVATGYGDTERAAIVDMLTNCWGNRYACAEALRAVGVANVTEEGIEWLAA